MGHALSPDQIQAAGLGVDAFVLVLALKWFRRRDDPEPEVTSTRSRTSNCRVLAIREWLTEPEITESSQDRPGQKEGLQDILDNLDKFPRRR